MGTTDTQFAGSIPSLYDRHLGPVLFEPYAEEVARRVAELAPRRILETAAGTGIVTAALARSVPDAEIVATDLNQAMLDLAAQHVGSGRVRFQQADAQQLPFADGAFDLVVCQFGAMFYPDKVGAAREARRVLADGGRYMMVVWDQLDKNPASHIIHKAIARLFPDDPPGFLARTPFAYWDTQKITDDLRAAGFADILVDTVELRSRRAATTQDAARGMVYGSPLRAEVEAQGAEALEQAASAADDALQRLVDSDGRLDSRLSAHIAVATR